MDSDRRGSSRDRGDPTVLHHVVGVVGVADEAESEGLHPADVLEKHLRIEMSWVVLHSSFRLGEGLSAPVRGAPVDRSTV